MSFLRNSCSTVRCVLHVPELVIIIIIIIIVTDSTIIIIIVIILFIIHQVCRQPT